MAIAVFHESTAASSSFVGASPGSMLSTSARCIRNTFNIASAFVAYPAKGPIREAILAEVA